MKVDETTIVMMGEFPIMIHRCGQIYFLHDTADIDMPLKQIDREKAWDYLNVSEDMRKILRH